MVDKFIIANVSCFQDSVTKIIKVGLFFIYAKIVEGWHFFLRQCIIYSVLLCIICKLFFVVAPFITS